MRPVRLQAIRDPAVPPWHELKKFDHHWLAVDAMKRSMDIREAPSPYRS